MNTPDNHRYREYDSKIQTAFIRLIEKQTSSKITVDNICREAQVNRTTFYSHYQNIYDLLIQAETKLRQSWMGDPLLGDATINAYMTSSHYLFSVTSRNTSSYIKSIYNMEIVS